MPDESDNEAMKEGVETLRKLLAATEFAASLVGTHSNLVNEISNLEAVKEELHDDIAAEQSRLATAQNAGIASKADWDEKIEGSKEKVNSIIRAAQEEANEILAEARRDNENLEADIKLRTSQRSRLDADIEDKQDKLAKIQKQMQEASASMNAAIQNVG